MQRTLVLSSVLVSVTLATVFMGTTIARGEIWTSGTESVGADSYGANPANPHIDIRQRLPAGDTMTANFTNNGNVITNADGSVPTWGGTVQEGSQGISFTSAGIVNGLAVTDIHQRHTHPDVSDGILEVAAFGDNGAAGLGGWLSGQGYADDQWLSVPDFNAGSFGDLYYGVDLSVWGASGIFVDDTMLGISIDVIGGISPQLPGIVFSSQSLSHGVQGWETDTPYSGSVTLDSYHMFSVPAPGALALLGCAGCLSRRRRRS